MHAIQINFIIIILLFHDEQRPVLCIPKSCVDHILDLFHSSLFGIWYTAGLTTNILTIKQKFYILNIMHNIHSFLKGCQICQLHKVGCTPQRQFENRINLNYTIMSKLRCNSKYMYRASTGHKFILVVADEVPNYLVTITLYRGTSHDIVETLINKVFYKHAPFLFDI